MHSRVFFIAAFVAASLILSTSRLDARVPMPAGAAPSAGITVTASGIVSTAATGATFSLLFSSRENTLHFNTQTLAPVIDAAVRSRRVPNRRPGVCTAARALSNRRRAQLILLVQCGIAEPQ